MPGVFLVNDLDGMLRTSEFASVAMVTSGEYGGESIEGVLDLPSSDPLGVVGTDPVFVAPSLPALSAGDLLTIDETDFRVKEPEPDGTGVTRYPLTEV